MGFGGPVWHVSIRHPNREKARAIAYAELEGVGDPALGQWEEQHTSFHLRRRLSPAEEAVIGGVVDIRGTPEAWARFKTLPAKIRKLCGGQAL